MILKDGKGPFDCWTGRGNDQPDNELTIFGACISGKNLETHDPRAISTETIIVKL